MAKSNKSKPRAAKPAVPGSVRRITHRTIMEGVEGKASYKVYGIAKKAIVQDTVYGRVPGLKGSFEAVAPGGDKLTSKRCFLPVELHADVAAKMNGSEEVSFGALVKVDGDNVTSEFFAEPAPTDPMANLRAEAAAA